MNVSPTVILVLVVRVKTNLFIPDGYLASAQLFIIHSEENPRPTATLEIAGSGEGGGTNKNICTSC